VTQLTRKLRHQRRPGKAPFAKGFASLRHRQQDESGAILILALVFLVAVSLIVIALLSLVGTSLTATASFTTERINETAATNAVNLAIQESRVTFAGQMQNAFGGATAAMPAQPSACWFSGGTPQQPPPIANQPQYYVWCSMIWQPFNTNTRTVTYSACLSSVSNVLCTLNPTLQVIEVFDDYPPGVGVPLVNPVQCNFYNYCGQSMTQVSWQWKPTVPVVTSISPTTTSIAGGTTVTITGTGFLHGSSVNFTEESGGTPTSNNVVVTVPASQVTASNCTGPNNTCTTLSLPAPSVTAGVPSGSLSASYFVTVTTPGMPTSGGIPTPGATSQFVQPGGVLNYTTVKPTVTGISGPVEVGGVPGGNITGGTTVTITGTGFFSASNFAAQVWFYCDTATNSSCSGASAVMASNVNVSSDTSLTAVTPAVTAAGNWYVQVDTIGGNSTQPPTLDFNYGVQVPIIINLSPSSGAAGTQININGGNFLSGSTVAFYLDQGGNQSGSAIPATAVINSPTSMTVTVPNSGLTANSQYFPVITLPAIQGYNGPTSSQPYNEPADIFTFTVVTPTVNVTYPDPVNNVHYYATGGGGRTVWSGPITGTASSNSTGTISTTAVAIEDTTKNLWWNGTSFSATSQTFVAATGTTSWSYTFPTSDFNGQNAGDHYSVIGEATDSLNNHGTSAAATFRFG
jgi:hypothetical protein